MADSKRSGWLCPDGGGVSDFNEPYPEMPEGVAGVLVPPEVKTDACRQWLSARSGGLVSPPETCSSCGDATNLHGHHNDYRQPLEVEWLCPHCHREVHAKLRAEYPDAFRAHREWRKRKKAFLRSLLYPVEETPSPWLTPGEVAERLDVDEHQVKQWRQLDHNPLPSYAITRVTVRFLAHEVDEWMQGNGKEEA